ncbi:hypothetical protein FRB95_005283 [Tulasnella sp. JGI-2019a]|nr:hypothetical protein FRB95_005283 [Tulasnella sp. JGI-2019a]
MDYEGLIASSEVIQFLQSPCPRLERFTLKTSSLRSPIGHSSGEHLRSVRLHGVDLRWDECTLRNFRTLSLHVSDTWGMDEGPSLQQILAILSRSLALKVLELTDMVDAYERGRTVVPMLEELAHVDQINLLSLWTLRIIDVSSAIPFPSSQQFTRLTLMTSIATPN